MSQMLAGRAAWTGAELEHSGDWIRTLDDRQRREIDAALHEVRRRTVGGNRQEMAGTRPAMTGGTKPVVTGWGTGPFDFGKADFPLDSTAALLADISDELENGRGAVRLRGLDVGRYSEDDLRRIFWGLGCHLGTALYQNARGEIMGEVRDESRLAEKTYAPLKAGKIVSSRARARSTGPLRWHTDRCDVIALLCARNARAGGVSKLASIVTIYNEILRRRPDLHALLCQDYWRSRPGDEDGQHTERAFPLPVFGVLDGKLTCQYSRTYVEQAQEFSEIPRLSAAQNEALDLLAEVADETCLFSAFEPGDIQLLNNHVVFHGRTAYDDDAASGRDRLLLRLWLAAPNSRRLPPGFDVLWGSTDSGAIRGGVVQPATASRTPVQ